MKKDFTQLVKIIILGFIISAGMTYVFSQTLQGNLQIGGASSTSWTSPAGAPPNANEAGPLDTSATPQAKGGSVVAGSLLDINGTLSAAALAVWGEAGNTDTVIGGSLKMNSLAGTEIQPLCVNNDGIIFPCVAPVCTSFTYSPWDSCQPDNTQTRTVISSGPIGCTGGSPVLSQSCTYSGYPSHNLYIIRSGTGKSTGNVTASTGTLSAWDNDMKTGSYATEDTVVLSASATTGATFTGWINPDGLTTGCDSTTGTLPNQTCTVIMSQGKVVYAEFAVMPPPVAPTVDLQVNGANSIPPILNSVNSITLSWTTANTTSCSATASPGNTGWTGSKNSQGGSQNVDPTTSNIAGNYTFTLACQGSGNQTATDSVTIAVQTAPYIGVDIYGSTPPSFTGSGGNAFVEWLIETLNVSPDFHCVTSSSPANTAWNAINPIVYNAEDSRTIYVPSYTEIFLKCYNSPGTSGPFVADSIEIDVNPVQTAPTLTTTVVSSIAGTTAASGGANIDSGNSFITAKGVVVSTSSNPTVFSYLVKTNDGTGANAFTSSITGLTAGTTYHVRAYATNNIGTSYGVDRSFITLAPGNQTFYSSATFTAPITGTYTIESWGAGGGGAGGGGSSSAGGLAGGGGGGGSGGYSSNAGGVTLAQGASINVVVGSGGSGGLGGNQNDYSACSNVTDGSNGVNGTDSYVTITGTEYARAYGGLAGQGGGKGCTSGGAYGIIGQGGSGNISSGNPGAAHTTYGGNGGASLTDGGYTAGGASGVNYSGDGQPGQTSVANNGGGAGGGGAGDGTHRGTGGNGGIGGNGRIKISWVPS